MIASAFVHDPRHPDYDCRFFFSALFDTGTTLFILAGLLDTTSERYFPLAADGRGERVSNPDARQFPILGRWEPHLTVRDSSGLLAGNTFLLFVLPERMTSSLNRMSFRQLPVACATVGTNAKRQHGARKGIFEILRFLIVC